MSTYVHKSPPSDHRRLPRKKCAPSSRDQAIYVAYRSRGRTQAGLAKDFGLTQSRISAILRRVERWLQTVGCVQSAPADETHHPAAGAFHAPYNYNASTSALWRRIEREQAQSIFDRAIRAFDSDKRELTTINEGHRGDKDFKETTRRQTPADAKLLRIASQASRDLGRLTERDAASERSRGGSPPGRTAEPKNLTERLDEIAAELNELRSKAVDAGKVRSVMDDEFFIGDLLKSILGEPNCGVGMRILVNDYVHGQNEGPCAFVPPSGEPEDDSARAGEAPRKGEAPAKPAASNPSNPTNSTQAELAEAEAPTDLPPEIQNPKSNIQNSPADKNSEQEAAREKLKRRIEHERKLREFQELQRRGLPCMMFFDPEFGPAPRDHYVLEDPGWKPTPPPSREEAEAANREYLAQIRAEQEANRRNYEEYLEAAKHS